MQFSHKYQDGDHARSYYLKHQRNWQRRLNNWREQCLARQALKLAGKPRTILDLPCGTGRFWSVLAEDPARKLYAADFSSEMMRMAFKVLSPTISRRFYCFQTAAQAIGMPANSVDCLFSMRLMHHIVLATDRFKILREFHRVTRNTVCLSLWLNNSLQARRRMRLEQKRPTRPYTNRTCLPASMVEKEYQQVGFKIRKRLAFLSGFSMWYFYVLEKVN